ncbi:FHA domain-containing protein [Streptomyces sp. NPDC005876]|uniref:FHA domain-containing protein n=1 Tax=Streptomyces sp. NPDC005876 TaxID=3157076 RepID=UPI0034040995
MQIRLTVVDPLGPSSSPAPGRAASCDVLVTAPVGTALAGVASALAAAVPGGDGSGPVVLYAGERRLDAQRCTLGEPPLIDGAVLYLGAPGDPEPHPESADAPTRLHVVAGPDAGGVHLLHGGQIRIGRSADADVPLDDPDVSRAHCAVTVAADGRVAVADLGSTNGTTLDGTRVGDRPVRFPPGALLRIGESALRLVPARGTHAGARAATTPDGEGFVRVPVAGGRAGEGAGPGRAGGEVRESGDVRTGGDSRESGDVRESGGLRAGGDLRESGGLRGSGEVREPGNVRAGGDVRESGGLRDGGDVWGGGDPRDSGDVRDEGDVREPGDVRGRGDVRESGDVRGRGDARESGDVRDGGGPAWGAAGSARAAGRPEWAAGAVREGEGSAQEAGAPRRATGHAYGTAGWGAAAETPGARGHGPAEPLVPGQGGAPRIESHGTGASGDTHGGRSGAVGFDADHLLGTGDPYGTSGLPPAPRPAAPDGGGAAGRGPGPHAPGPSPDRNGTSSSSSSPPPATGGRKGTPLRGTDVPPGVRRRGGLSAWARKLTGGRAEQAPLPEEGEYGAEGPPPADPSPVPETWPDAAALLLTALGPGPRLWERGPAHPELLAVRLGTADRVAPGGAPLPAVPVTAGLRESGALGLAGPRERLAGLARSVLAQLAALHSPDLLEIVLISADRARPAAERSAEWSWLGWLPHLRPGHGQDCRLLLAFDREQATARGQELLRRLDDHLTDARTGSARTPSAERPPAPADSAPRPSWARADDGTGPIGGGHPGPYTVVVVDGDPGGADLRETVARLALEGPRAGMHVVCLAETAAASPASPVTETYEAACAANPVFRECGAVALLSGDVATALRLLRVARTGAAPAGPVGHGTLGTVDAVSAAWAERFARALAPLRPEGGAGERHTRVSAPLPQAARLLDELGLARATPASLMARWADAADDPQALGGRAEAVLGAGPRGPVGVDLAAEGPHLLIEGPPGSGRTELLRALVASLASAERPDRLGVVLIDGRDGTGAGAGGGPGEDLRVCLDVPHVTTHLAANDPVRMREFAQSLSAELKRRAELLGRSDFAEWHTGRAVSGRMVAQRTPAPGSGGGGGAGDLDSPPSSTLKLRPGAARRRAQAAPPLPRLVVVVDDLDALVTPPLGSPGRPAAGSVMRALEAVAREGERLGVHLVAATAPGGRTAQTEPVRRATLRVTLDAPVPGPDEPAPGRGRLASPDGRVTPFQGGRVTGRIPRTATLRPTVLPLEWHRMGDPPARRPVRELGNGPTDLALLASALERAAREVSAAEVPSLL